MRSVLLMGVLLLAGCADTGRLPTYATTGLVRFPDGQPLPGGWIICHAPDHGLAARGVIETDGTFQLGTYGPTDGAVAGQQLIAITPASPANHDPDRSAAAPQIHSRYSHMQSSGLEFEVTRQGPNHFELIVER